MNDMQWILQALITRALARTMTTTTSSVWWCWLYKRGRQSLWHTSRRLMAAGSQAPNILRGISEPPKIFAKEQKNLSNDIFMCIYIMQRIFIFVCFFFRFVFCSVVDYGFSHIIVEWCDVYGLLLFSIVKHAEEIWSFYKGYIFIHMYYIFSVHYIYYISYKCLASARLVFFSIKYFIYIRRRRCRRFFSILYIYTTLRFGAFFASLTYIFIVYYAKFATYQIYFL